MMQAWWYARAWRVAAALLLLAPLAAVQSAVAQDDPLGDVGDEPAPGEGAPAEEPAPAPPAEPAPEEPAAPPVEGEINAEGGVEAGTALEAEVSADVGPEATPAEGAPTEEEPADEGEMIVTGSRVKRSNFAQPSAVQVVDRKQLQVSGADNMADVVKTMTINSGSEFNTDVASGAVGTAQFNLRGLGFASTLVLLNGRRMVTSGAGSQDGSNFVDINTIPLNVIERIEVLKGGASAIYGSDAIAGVVNIITRKHMDGFEANAGVQTTDDFDHHEWDVSLIGGAEGENTRVMGSASFFRRSPLKADDRDFTKNGRNVSNLGYPSAWVRLYPNMAMNPDMTPNVSARLAAPFVSRPIPRLDADGNPAMNSAGAPAFWLDTFQDPACGDARLSAPTRDPDASLNFCTLDFNPYFMLMVDEQRANVMTTVEQDLGEHTMAFFEAAYAQSRTSRELSPAYPILASTTVSPAHAYSPEQLPLAWQGRAAGGESPPYVNYYDSDTLHTVAGIGGDFGWAGEGMAEDWEWELAGTWSTNRYKVFAEDVLRPALQGALAMCTNTGMAHTTTATGTTPSPVHDPNLCWNPFSMDELGGAPNSRAIRDRVVGQLRTQADIELTTANLDFGGPIVELPGGDLAVAFGGQVRRETAQQDADHDSNIENYIFLIGGPDWQAERTIWAGYAELGAPVVEGADIQLAGRFEEYDDVGSTFNYMAGLSWTPAKTFMGDEASQASRIRIRGTFTTAFRAPSLLQTNGAITELAETYNVSNIAGTPVQSTTPTYRAVRSLGNPDLEPQTSNAITAGFDWSPVQGLFIEADYWNYNYDDIIVRENAQQIIAADFMRLSDPRIIRDPVTGLPSIINTTFINAAGVETQGIDVNLMFASNFGATAGTFSIGANGTFTLTYKIPQAQISPSLWDEDFFDCDQPNLALSGNVNSTPNPDSRCEVAGTRNFQNFARSLPKLRASFPLGWTLEGHTVALIMNFISGYKDDFDSDSRPPLREVDPATMMMIGAIRDQREEYRDIDAWFTMDLQYALRINETEDMATTLKLGVVNLLDSDPPPVNAGYGYDVVTHDPRGRLLYARLTQEF